METRKAPNRSTASQKPDRRAEYPSQNYPVRLTLGTGQVRSPAALLQKERWVGIRLLTSLFLAGYQQRPLLPSPEVEQMFGVAVPDAQKGISRTETGSSIRKMSALSTARGALGCSVPGSRTQPSLAA